MGTEESHRVHPGIRSVGDPGQNTRRVLDPTRTLTGSDISGYDGIITLEVPRV